MARPSAFKSDEARAAYCRLYNEAIALSEVPVDESDIQSSFGTTHVLTAGDPSKPPLVALHGMATSSTMWLPLLPALTASHRVRMLDSIGDVGKSVATGVLSSPARVVDWIDEALDRLGVERAAFMAASTGAWMATHYAMARQDRVERLAFVCPAGIVSAQHTRWLIRAFMDGLLSRHAPEVRGVRRLPGDGEISAAHAHRPVASHCGAIDHRATHVPAGTARASPGALRYPATR